MNSFSKLPYDEQVEVVACILELLKVRKWTDVQGYIAGGRINVAGLWRAACNLAEVGDCEPWANFPYLPEVVHEVRELAESEV